MAGSFDRATINQVQQSNDIVDVVGEHVSLARRGREMVGLCPFHDDHRPSMYVNPAKQIFKCFACGAGGSVFTFVQMRENLSFPQTIERLAERAGIKIKAARPSREKTRDQVDVDPNELARVNAWAARYFQQNLLKTDEGTQALSYLAERRITLESTKKWQLGLALRSGNDLIRTAGKKIRPSLLGSAGLVTGNTTAACDDKFVNRLMFPITGVTGRVIGFGGRTLDEKGAKYINSPTTVLFDKSNCLYGLEHARHAIVATGTAVVVEGYTDCIMAHQLGCNNVVATLGTSFTEGHARILRRYAKKVVLLFDSDAAGIEAANRALQICLARRIDIKLASVPDAKDPCDFLLSAGKEGFEDLVENAVDVFAFKWNRLTESFRKDDSIIDNKAAAEEFLQSIAVGILAGNLSAIDKGLIVNRLSSLIGLSSKEVNEEIAARVRRSARTAGYNTKPQPEEDLDLGRGLFAAAQREILEVLLSQPKLFETAGQRISADVFDVPVLRQIATILFEVLAAEPQASLATILARSESVQLGSVIVRLAQTGEEKANFESRLAGALEAIERYQAQQARTKVGTTKDHELFLRQFSENTPKRNPHNVGMT
ncbi:MAG: DNA primase [Planctomycetota bacterium]